MPQVLLSMEDPQLSCDVRTIVFPQLMKRFAASDPAIPDNPGDLIREDPVTICVWAGHDVFTVELILTQAFDLGL